MENPLKIGVDFDNTIVKYDELIYDIAIRKGFIDSGQEKNKKLIRDAVRKTQDGELKWMAVQAEAYGPGISSARPFNGVEEFFRLCAEKRYRTYIVSHKTEYAASEPGGINLREAAMSWMQERGFYGDEDIGVDKERVHFESSRLEKISRIKSLGLTHFIDDLEETFLEATFPGDVQKILFCPSAPDSIPEGSLVFRSWDEIICYFISVGKGFGVKTLERLVNERVFSAEMIGKGKNSFVYLMRTYGKKRFAAKFYNGKTMEGRSRGFVEFSALRFLWDNGIRSIPEPVSADFENDVAIYEYIGANEVDSGQISEADIDQALEFLLKLNKISGAEGSGELYPASEACFSLTELTVNIQKRIDSLKAVEKNQRLRNFLSTDFSPAFIKLSGWAEKYLEVNGIGYAESLPLAQRILSPSDFGFHNARRMEDGQLKFVDFEYFGWDDPAKLISDFLYHPGMNLDDELKLRFIEGSMKIFGQSGQLDIRLRALYPLFGMKWIMIFLNEFLPGRLDRLGMSPNGERAAIVKERQLEKANSLLGYIIESYKHPPCFN